MSSFCIKGSKVLPVICPFLLLQCPPSWSELWQMGFVRVYVRWRGTCSQTQACGEQRSVLCCLVLLSTLSFEIGSLSLNLELTDLEDLLASVSPGSSRPYLPILVLQAHAATPDLLIWVQPCSGHCDHTTCTLPTGPSPSPGVSP